MTEYKFGKRESDALFDLMRTLEISNLKEPVSYLKVIKEAHKEILRLRGQVDAYNALKEEQKPSGFDKWRII